MRELIITGIPRSGTTLVTALIDALPDTLALNEPLWQFAWMEAHAAQGPQGFVRWLKTDFARVRADALAGMALRDRRKADGSPATENHRDGAFGAVDAQGIQEVTFHKQGLTPDCLIAAKHLGPYMACLPWLCADFNVLAVLRHPVPVIASWNHVPIPLREGRMTGAAVLWKEVREVGEGSEATLVKQMQIYELLCQRLWACREQIALLRYEDFITEPVRVMQAIGFPASMLPQGIVQPPKAQNQESEQAHTIRAWMRQHGEYASKFYPD